MAGDIGRPPRIKQIDITRALRAIRNAGVEPSRIDIDLAAGRIVIVTGQAEQVTPANAFDEWKSRHARSS